MFNFWRLLGASDRILLFTGIATLVTAFVTVLLAWSTYKVASLSAQEVQVEHTVLIFRSCVVASRSEAKDGDALLDLSPGDSGYQYDERLSRDVLLKYLTHDIDYLRCEIVNLGRLPVTRVSVSLTGQFKHMKPFFIVASPITFLSSDQTPSLARKIIWLVNNSGVPITVYNPDKVRFYTVEGVSQVQRLQPAGLSDRWFLANGKDTVEDLDQGIMNSL